MTGLAGAVRGEIGAKPSEAIDTAAAAQLLGCRVIERRDVDPHLQAALVPSTEAGFVIWLLKRIDPEATNPPSGVDTPKDRFLILHELAHTFFYSRGQVPHRRMGPAADNEEYLCDVFAAEALVPHDGLSAPIESVVKTYQAPEAIARWARLSRFSIERWRESVDRCTGPGW